MEKMTGAQGRKRGPNSPNESEKQKLRSEQSTSAAATTLGVATMLSTLSSVFSAQRANSTVSDSDDEHTDQDNVWNSANLNNSKVKSPRKAGDPIEPLFSHHSEGAWRDEIEIEVQNKNDKKFTGTITPIEAKHLVYIGALKFENHDNFDGVRINWKGKLIITFKLINPINIDELESVEYFDFVRTTSIRGKKVEEKIGCKIKGIRSRPSTVSAFDEVRETGHKLVKIEGCEYRLAEDEIIAWLSLYGEVVSKLEEDCFRDESATTGNNRSGNYSVMMKLNQNIPQLIPMCGRRIKIYHAGITKLCTQCFGEHRKQYCPNNEKTPWTEYVRNFIDSNPEIPSEFFGKWVEIVNKVSSERTRGRRFSNPDPIQNDDEETDNLIGNTQEGCSNSQNHEQITKESTSTPNPIKDTANKVQELKEPTEEEFDIPTTEEAYERMVERFASIGLAKWETDKAIEQKRTAYNRACREYKKAVEKKKKTDDPKQKRAGRKTSLPRN